MAYCGKMYRKKKYRNYYRKRAYGGNQLSKNFSGLWAPDVTVVKLKWFDNPVSILTVAPINYRQTYYRANVLGPLNPLLPMSGSLSGQHAYDSPPGSMQWGQLYQNYIILKCKIKLSIATQHDHQIPTIVSIFPTYGGSEATMPGIAKDDVPPYLNRKGCKWHLLSGAKGKQATWNYENTISIADMLGITEQQYISQNKYWGGFGSEDTSNLWKWVDNQDNTAILIGWWMTYMQPDQSAITSDSLVWSVTLEWDVRLFNLGKGYLPPDELPHP